jgi:hypothetical protein
MGVIADGRLTDNIRTFYGYSTTDMLGVSTDMLSVHMYKSYKDAIYVFITLVHICMDITFSFSHDLTTNGKQKESLNFCWRRILIVADFTAAHFLLF